MSKTFKNLVLYPTIFLGTIIFAIGLQGRSWTFIFTLVLVLEHLYTWNESLKQEKYSDFRVFFAEQYTRFYYLILTFVIGITIIFTWDLIGFWTLFSYALNFLIFRAFSSVGIKKISDAAPTPSKIINIDNSIWKDNKKLLKEFIEAELINSNSKKIQKIYDAIEYSSFLRSTKATEIIKDLINSDEKNKDVLLDELLFRL